MTRSPSYFMIPVGDLPLLDHAIAADVALIPFALFLGAGPITDAVEGALLNIANLIP